MTSDDNLDILLSRKMIYSLWPRVCRLQSNLLLSEGDAFKLLTLWESFMTSCGSSWDYRGGAPALLSLTSCRRWWWWYRLSPSNSRVRTVHRDSSTKLNTGRSAGKYWWCSLHNATTKKKRKWANVIIWQEYCRKFKFDCHWCSLSCKTLDEIIQ